MNVQPNSRESTDEPTVQHSRSKPAGLVKAFGDTTAVDGGDLAVRTGSVYGVLLTPLATRSTISAMPRRRADGGSARVLGHDVVREADAVRGVASLTGQLASATRT